MSRVLYVLSFVLVASTVLLLLVNPERPPAPMCGLMVLGVACSFLPRFLPPR
jgi:hypothetical protein